MGAGLSRFGPSVENKPIDALGLPVTENATHKDGKLFVVPYNVNGHAKVVLLSDPQKINVAKIGREITIFKKYGHQINKSPYFLDFVESFSMSASEFLVSQDPARKQLFETHLKERMTEEKDTAFVVVTKLVQNPRTLREIFEKAKGEYGRCHYGLCMQVLQALKKLREWKIVHNDFHIDNIMVVPNENMTRYTFESYDRGKNISFESMYCIQVFDWDMAVTDDLKNDFITERAISFSEDEEKRDLAAFFMCLVQWQVINAEAELKAANSHRTDDDDLEYHDCFNIVLSPARIVDGICNALFADTTYETIWGKLYDIFYEKLTEAKSNDGTRLNFFGCVDLLV